MNKLFYPKLAVTNMKKNRKFYFPYILTGILTIMMFYNMCSIASHQGLKQMQGADSITMMMGMGCYIIGLFAIIFLFYTNNFLMRRRKKEIGLYNILGMEKRHIAKVLFFETLFTAVIAIGVGLLCGMLFNQLIVLLMDQIFHFPVVLKSEVNAISVNATIILFLIIYALSLLFNLAKISLSKPIEMLYGQNAGEREPKTKKLMAILGFACLGGGYYIALTTESPIAALGFFFVAVILVILGTYFLFTAGSIAILKILKKKKSFYYQTKHFTAVSGMIYRMKQNAVGLANICILSTMVLVMLSGTVSLYLGLEDTVEKMYPSDMTVLAYYDNDKPIDKDAMLTAIEDAFAETDCQITTESSITYLESAAIRKNGEFEFVKPYMIATPSKTHELIFYTMDEYNKLTGQDRSLEPQHVLACSTAEQIGDTLLVCGMSFQVESLKEFPVNSEYVNYLDNLHYIVVPDQESLDAIYKKQKEAYKENASDMEFQVTMDLTGDKDQQIAAGDHLKEVMSKYAKEHDGFVRISTSGKQQNRNMSLSLYGGFLFLGVFLGTLFIMATVLIIYYKQISEGYEDKERFAIMQKVGMTRSEVKKSIHSQIMMVFFLPLAAACIHLLAAFKIISKLLALLCLTNITLFVTCTICTVVIFAIIYAIVYALTAKTYYKIVD